MKRCSKCKEIKTFESFYKVKSRNDGHHNYCKVCNSEYQKNKTKTNPGYSRDYYRANREKLNLLVREWKRRNPEKVKEYRKKDVRLKLNELTPEKRKKRKEEMARYNKLHPYKPSKEQIKHQNRLKWARRNKAEGKYTREEWYVVVENQSYKCLFCGVHNDDSPITADHIIPLSKGGSNYISNIQGLCRSCNSRKGNTIKKETPVVTGVSTL